MRPVRLLLALTLLFFARVASGEEFLISYWWGPQMTPQSAKLVAGANFNVAMLGGSSVGDIRAQLDVCAANGLKGLVNVDGNRLMARQPSDPGFAAGIDAVVRDYGSHPALWGYFLQDEPGSPEQVRQLAEVNRLLTAKDRERVPFINLLPVQAWKPYAANVESYVRTVSPKLLSFDKYALFADSEAPDFYENLELIRQAGRKYNLPFNYILLATPHGSYRDPSEADLRWQVYSALAYGARGIMYFTYVTPPADDPNYAGWGQGIIGRDGAPTARYNAVRDINAEVRRIAPILTDLRSVGVYHTDPVPAGCHPMPDGDLILDITGGEFVVGRFRSTSGQTYLMFVNRDPRHEAYANIVFSESLRLARIDLKTGRTHPVALRYNGERCYWRTSFAPGEARLVRLR